MQRVVGAVGHDLPAPHLNEQSLVADRVDVMHVLDPLIDSKPYAEVLSKVVPRGLENRVALADLLYLLDLLDLANLSDL